MKYFFIWIAAAAIAFFAASTSIGAAAKKSAPELASSMFPQNGFAIENLTTKLNTAAIVEAGGKLPDKAEPKLLSLANNAFSAEPATPDAVAIIALKQSGPKRKLLMQKAYALSRRAPFATAWLIADSSANNDIGSVLQYYDSILRTNASAMEVVMPIMVGALSNDAAIEPYAKILEQNPPWAANFWGQVPSAPAALGNATDLRQLLHKRNVKSPGFRDETLINALVNNYKFEEANQIYLLHNKKGKGGGIIRNGDFQKPSIYPPLDWQLNSTGEYGAAIEDGQLNLSAVSNSGGVFARQLIEMPRGALNLTIALTATPPVESKINVQISCAQQTSNIGNVVQLPITATQTSIVMRNDRNDCRFFWLDIAALSSQYGDGFDVGMKSISIAPK